MFKVRPYEVKTLSWWFDQKDNIDFKPSYQRKGGLWSKQDKAYLIDSILNSFDIPKIYIADFTYLNTALNEHKKQYSIIDGKQRFEAIFDFFEGKIELNDDFDYSENPRLKLAGLGFKDLKANYAKIAAIFENYNLSVMSVITDEESKINELFIRLNRNKPLVGAEIRGAMRGEIPKLIKKIVDNKFFIENIRFTTKRKQDENLAAKLLLIEFRGGFVDTKKIHLDRFVEEGLKTEATDFKKAEKRVSSILKDMNEIFQVKDKLLKGSGHIPVYYWFIKKNRKNKNEIRDFLIKFENLRVENRQKDPKKSSIIKELADYDLHIRNANDQGSLTKCYKILNQIFYDMIDARSEVT